MSSDATEPTPDSEALVPMATSDALVAPADAADAAPGSAPLSPVSPVSAASPTSPATPSSPIQPYDGELVTFRVVFAKQTYNVDFGLDQTVLQLKVHLYKLCGVPIGGQKLMYKGLLGDGETLRERKFKKNAKCLLVGATGEQIMETARMDMGEPMVDGPGGTAETKAAEEKKWCEMPEHLKVLKKGKPDDVMMAYRPLDGPDPLPTTQIRGLYTAKGKVRLTFKMSEQTLVIGTNERTTPVPMGSINGCVSQEIPGFEEYHILALQLGKTERSRQYIYWFPAQYVGSVRRLFGAPK